VQSFGLGIKGMRGAEIHHYIERILELHLPKLKGQEAKVASARAGRHQKSALRPECVPHRSM
jgi:hypothetical protein